MADAGGDERTELARLYERAVSLDPVDDTAEIGTLFEQALTLVDSGAEPLKYASICAGFASMFLDVDRAVPTYHEAVRHFAASDDPELRSHAVELANLGAELRLTQPNVDIEVAIAERWVWSTYDRDMLLPLADLHDRRVEGEPLDNWRTRVAILQTRLDELDHRVSPTAWVSFNDALAIAQADEPDGDWETLYRRRVEQHRVSLEVLGDHDGQARLMCHVHLSEALAALVPASAGERYAFQTEAVRHAQLAYDLVSAELDPDIARIATQNLATMAIRQNDPDPADVDRQIELLGEAQGLLDPTTHPASAANLLKARCLLIERRIESGQGRVGDLDDLLRDTARAIELLGVAAPDERYHLHNARVRSLIRARRFDEALPDGHAALTIAAGLMAVSEARASRLEASRWLGDAASTAAFLHLMTDDVDRAVATLERGRAQLANTTGTATNDVDVDALIPHDGALLMTCFAGDPGWVIVVTANATSALQLSDLARTDLDELVAGDDIDNRLGGWMRAYALHRADGPANRQAFLDEIERTATELSDRFWVPVVAELDRLGIETGSELVLFLDGAASALSFNAAPLARDGATGHVIDHYQLRSAPSLRVLQTAIAGSDRPLAQPGVIADPRSDLHYEDLEVIALANHIGEADVRRGDEATTDALFALLEQCDIVQVCAHAEHEMTNIWGSRLKLANGLDLRLDELAHRFADHSIASRLVFLGSCESGTPRVTSHANELLGFPTVLLEAGASTVVSSQWRADDMATALLVWMFYRHLGAGDPPAEALRQAQRHLRDATGKELRQMLREIGKDHPAVKATTGKLRLSIRALGSDEHPFAHPWNWAAFVAHGG